MKNYIIGTAGHVDHGKTMLIKALTGIDTDRLKEEKKRGITIELGFAHITLPHGEQAGIIDVPGHEKFVKNMLAGAGGIDLVLLVVAADEGFMPQTREHLGILSLLGIQNGIIVLTKTDMVDEEWLEVVKEDIRSEVQGSFLADAPIVPVSAYTGDGIEGLRLLIEEKLQAVQQKNTSKPFRIPVDRVFSVDGFGTVITGTLIEGTVTEGDEVMIYPGEKLTKVRNLQVHNQTVSTAYAGQRVAVNLANIKKSELESFSKNGRELPFLFSQTPGILAWGENGLGTGTSAMRIRGAAGSRINITLDGVALNSPEDQTVFWANMNSYAALLGSVQIQRGIDQRRRCFRWRHIAGNCPTAIQALIGADRFIRLIQDLQCWSLFLNGIALQPSHLRRRLPRNGYRRIRPRHTGPVGLILRRTDMDWKQLPNSL